MDQLAEEGLESSRFFLCKITLTLSQIFFARLQASDKTVSMGTPNLTLELRMVVSVAGVQF
jgi:hypothetical protein